MHDPALVRSLDGRGHLHAQRQHLAQRQRSPPEPRGERLALDQLEHQARRVGAVLQPVDGRHVRVVERGQRLRLAPEAREPPGVGRERGGQHLDGHVAPELGVARAVHLAHAARAERSDDLERAEPEECA